MKWLKFQPPVGRKRYYVTRKDDKMADRYYFKLKAFLEHLEKKENRVNLIHIVIDLTKVSDLVL